MAAVNIGLIHQETADLCNVMDSARIKNPPKPVQLASMPGTGFTEFLKIQFVYHKRFEGVKTLKQLS